MSAEQQGGRGRLRRALEWMNRPAELPVASKSQIKAFDASLIGLVSLAALAAYVFQPVQRFANYDQLFVGAMLVAFGLIPGWILRRRDVPIVVLYASATFVALGAVTLFFTGNTAVSRSEWNDRRCLRIQEAMLRPTPQTRSDLPDLFAALECRPQGGPPSSPDLKRPDRYRQPDMKVVEAHWRFEQATLENEVQLMAPEENSGAIVTDRDRKALSVPR